MIFTYCQALCPLVARLGSAPLIFYSRIPSYPHISSSLMWFCCKRSAINFLFPLPFQHLVLPVIMLQYYDRCWLLSEPLNVPAKCFFSCNRAYTRQNSFRSPGVRQSTSYGCGLCIYVIVPMQYRASVCWATSPGLNPPHIQFLFVSPHICRRLPSDSQSPTTPLS